ncbi:hypothetical protein P691DRAFT_768264 [Macrolepiota fuliginosa MF-IS2]|uniref:G domain-containing protein n=1 Tax=Macrolepiota fuliginosa MF-IS2 TaxID=1400762 RepID=A0A9P5WXF6_9AGAR|nr:hypothetical protein P691DRAFT_768264 [Macrolepiota fuliginosa MF-IS2]
MRDKRTDSGVLDSISRRDILIVVVGNAGVGKSTFINKAVTKGLSPIDQASKIDNEVQYIACSRPELYQDRKIVFLDIPAFGPESDEKAIQNNLRYWLRVVISKRLNISGTLYLHRMTETEFSGTSLRHLTSLMTIFEELSQSPIGVLLVLTMQAQLSLLIRLQRKKEIQEKWNTLFPLDPLRSIVSATRPTASIHTQRVATGSGESLKRRLVLLGISNMESLPAPLLSTHAIDNLTSGFVPARQNATPEKANESEDNIKNPKRLSSLPMNNTSTSGPKQARTTFEFIKKVDEKDPVALPHS